MELRKRAEDFVSALYRPQGAVHPTKAQVFEFLESADIFHQEEYEAWEKEEVICRGREALILGEYFPILEAKGCVILSHGYAQNRYILTPQQKILRELGYDTLIFDQRAFGESTEPHGTFGWREGVDIADLVRWIKERCGKDTKVLVLGVSMGAASAMNALRYTNDISAVIEDCGFADLFDCLDDLYRSFYPEEKNPYVAETLLRYSSSLDIPVERNCPQSAVEACRIPICIFHGDGDQTIGVSHAWKIYTSCSHPQSRLYIYPGIDHAMCVSRRGQYKANLQEFLRHI